MELQILATGFYFRGNLGDELYPLVLRRMFGAHIECHCTDDLHSVPSGTDAIIVGGGDVVNPWFMDKIAALIAGFSGPVYLLSAGIPFGGSDLRYLRMFDHVFVRTAADFAVASSVLPSSDVTYYRDMAWSLPRTPRIAPRVVSKLRVALTLAQPYFADNACAEAMKQELVSLVTSLAARSSEVLLLPFNTRLAAKAECDVYLNREICQRSGGLPNVVCVEDEALSADPEAMLRLFDTLDLLVAMRLHSVIFALMQRLPFVCMYTTQKVANVLQDVGATEWGLRMPVDERYKPLRIDAQAVLQLADRRLAAEAAGTYVWQEPAAPPIDWQHVGALVSARKRKAVLMGAPPAVPSFAEAKARCKRLVLGYTGMSEATYASWLNGELQTLQAVDEHSISLVELCRLICYALTDSTTSACLWGLYENCQKPGFKLLDALGYIHGDTVTKAIAMLMQQASAYDCSSSSSSSSDVVVELTRQDLHEFADSHRAGWPYVVKGLMGRFVGDNNNKQSKARVLLDTYVDRTFHWGHDALLQDGTIPYKTPWMGFVHHTFTTDHGPYNCTTLFAKPAFLQSLAQCKCLIALSQYLAGGLRHALDRAGYGHVGVEVLLHPTEPVPSELCFSMDKLLSNPQPKLVQVGSWLRSAYALYKLPTVLHGDLRLQRCILKAKESTNYMKPRSLDGALQQMLEESQALRDKNFPKAYNWYVKELIEHLREQEQSVQLLDRLSNTDYDQLLAQNVAFLRLVDCSACNTIIETIVRDGVVICNRHPAAVEYLTADYPGFYDTLSEAAEISSSTARLRACHEHIKALDKDRLSLQAFLDGFQAILDKHL